MFEPYSEKARRTTFFARHEASQFGSTSIEAEHLLLSLLRVGEAVAYRSPLPRTAAGSAEGGGVMVPYPMRPGLWGRKGEIPGVSGRNVGM